MFCKTWPTCFSAITVLTIIKPFICNYSLLPIQLVFARQGSIIKIMNQLSIPQLFAVWVLPVLFAITVHEVAHGWVASKLGDNTAKMLGRLTLNPLKHIDIIGTIIVPAILLLLGGFIFGWAKPVPINWRKLHHPKRDMALVAIAGPLANLLMAIAWAAIAKIGSMIAPPIGTAIFDMGNAGILINLLLMILNIIPIPPLDGSRVVSSFLSPQAALYYNRLEMWGFVILLALLATGVLGFIIGPPVFGLRHLLLTIFGFG